MIGIVVSRADEASVAIGERLLEATAWEAHRDETRSDGDGGGTYHTTDGFELRAFDALHLELAGVAEAFGDPDLVVFVSRHAGETGPLLTAHFTGNVGPAEYGGRPNELARACPNALARVLSALSERAPDGYDVAMECTHHGPSVVGAPSAFVEVGSSRTQWRDPGAATAVARAVLDLAGTSPDRERTLVGFGGGHYAPRFLRIVRETDWAVGHVLADWSIDAAGGLPADVIDQAFEQSAATRAVVDGDHPALVEAIEERGFRVVGETWARETTGVPLDLVDRAERTLRPVDAGLRFGAPRAEDVAVDELNPDLVAAALGTDSAATVEAVDRHAVAYETAEGGTRPTGRLLRPADATLDPLVEALMAVLRAGGATAVRDGDVVVVEETVFDPDAARRLGVPEGPAFGRLASGEPVEVEGRRVAPESVHTSVTRQIPIAPARS